MSAAKIGQSGTIGQSSESLSPRFLKAAARSVLAICIAVCLSVQVSARESRVQFDVPRTLSCRDVTPSEFRATHPSEKLIQLEVDISVIAREYSPRLADVFFRIGFPDPVYRVEDYSPRTMLASSFTGEIDVQAARNSQTAWQLSASGQYGPFSQADGFSKFDARENSRLSGSLAPPQELVTAAGTFGGGSGIFFRRRPNGQTTLEGATHFVVVVRVPERWRGDYAVVTCEATSLRKDILSEQEFIPCGKCQYFVALYLEGDEEVQRLASRVAKSEVLLRREIMASHVAASRRNHVSLATLIGLRGASADRSTPVHWVEQLVFSGPSNQVRVDTPLSAETRRLAEEFLSTRDELHRARGAGQ